MAETDQVAKEFQVGGFVILENIIPEASCEPLRERLLDLASQLRDEKALANQVSFIPGAINYAPELGEYTAHSRILDLARSLLQSPPRISFTSVIINEAGKERGNWHADWPFNQNNACHVPAPYPDRIMHLTALLMVSPFTEENGGTLVVPGSHRYSNNPTDKTLGVDPFAPYPTEFRVTAPAGSLVLFDSRLWHCPPANPSTEARVAVAIRYAPWWLNLEPLDPHSEARKQWVEEPGLNENRVPRIPREAFQKIPDHAKPLYRHWVEPSTESNP